MMTTPNDLDGRLRAELIESVSDVQADYATVDRLIRTATTAKPVQRRHRVWIAPMLAAAAVIAIVVVTTAVVATSDDADRRTPPVTTRTSPAPVSSPTPTSAPTSPPASVSTSVS